jgi:hypothetical protein
LPRNFTFSRQNLVTNLMGRETPLAAKLPSILT